MSLMIICLKKQKICFTHFAIKNKVSATRLNFKRDKNVEFNFRDYKSLKELFKDIYYKKFSIEVEEGVQDECKAVLDKLEEYNSGNPEHKKVKINLLDNAKKLHDGREVIINAFQSKIFPLKYDEEKKAILKMKMKMVLLIIKYFIA